MWNGIEALLLLPSASMTLSLAFRARSLGLRWPARSSFAAATGSLALLLVITSWVNDGASLFAVIPIWGAVIGQALWAAWSSSRASLDSYVTGSGARVRMLCIGYVALALFDALLAGSSLTLGRASDGLLPWSLAVAAAIGALITVSVGAVGLARRHEQRGAFGHAWLAWILAIWSGGGLLFTGLAMVANVTTVIPAVLLLGFPIVTPIATRLLVGKGPVPLDLESYDYLDAKPAVAGGRGRGALIALCALAFGLQALAFSRHYGSCGGVLVPASVPPHWLDLPSEQWTSNSDGTVPTIGRFHFRAAHFDYKGYPAAYTDAALSDPALCFASTVSLRSWFDADLAMYRSPSDLRLRFDAQTNVFLIAGVSHEGTDHDQLIAAFRVQKSQRTAFDSDLSRDYVLTGMALLLLGVGCTWLRFRLNRQPEIQVVRSRRVLIVAVASLVAASATPLLLKSRWNAASTPRPGRELAVDYAWMI